MKIRKTKIVATVGPACAGEKKLKALIQAGVDVFRINSSHTSSEELKGWILSVQKASSGAHKHVSILVDLQGPRIRTGTLRGSSPISLKKGSTVTMISSSKAGDSSTITTSCEKFHQMVKAGDPILLDNGHMELHVLKVKKKVVTCKVIHGGSLGENKGINLPYAPNILPALTDKDRKAALVAAKMKVDYLALSFVRNREDILVLRKHLKKHGLKTAIIAKIEKPTAVLHLDEIMSAVEGLMIARGDLGIEMGVEKVPIIQKQLIKRASETLLPVITATQMLESMMKSSRPTRAEASDIANAVFDGSDAVMLSGETAVGQYPIKAVKTMSGIILEAEQYTAGKDETSMELAQPTHDQCVQSVSHAACNLADRLGAKAVLIFTRSGKTAAIVSKLMPNAQIIAFVPNEEVARGLSVFLGVRSMIMDYRHDFDWMIRKSDKLVLKEGLLHRNDPVVILSGKQAFPSFLYMTKIHRIGLY